MTLERFDANDGPQSVPCAGLGDFSMHLLKCAELSLTTSVPKGAVLCQSKM